jgi:hypothetical protein
MMTKSELAKAERDAEKARCAVCGKKVTMEDRCNDGLYIHRECAYKTASR